MAPKLEIDRLSKVYGDHPDQALRLIGEGASPKDVFARTSQVVAVSDVSFAVDEGEIFTIMGLSGSGKSTLVRCINRIIEPSAGRIVIDDEDVLAMSRARLRELRRRKVAMVFQNFALLPHRTVLENVEFGLMIRGEDIAARRRRCDAALAQVGLSEWAARYPDNLSGGMKQRVGLARALASDPDVLLMDEPFSALDPLIRSELQLELLRLQRTIRKTIVFITHDFHEAVRLSDHLAVMREGSFVQVGSPHDIVLDPADDYVATFARDLDRSKLLTAGDVATRRIPIIAADVGPEAMREQVTRSGAPYAVLIDAAGRPSGYVSRDELGATLRRREVRSLPAATPLPDMYAALGANAPVAIVADDGTAIGAVDASDVIRRLGEPARAASASIGGVAGHSVRPS